MLLFYGKLEHSFSQIREKIQVDVSGLISKNIASSWWIIMVVVYAVENSWQQWHLYFQGN